MNQDEYWTYHETNESGELVSTIEYWHCTLTVPPFTSDSGYRRHDTSGKLISSGVY